MTALRLLWHDYETFGADPARDRPAQFAALATNEALEPIGEPVVLHCRPTLDCLPHPDAVLLTGITPQRADRDGLDEPMFARRIQALLSEPHTCAVGYNSIRFDGAVTRYLFWRNFLDPYRHEWDYGNSCWDLLDVVRLWHALRPDGLEWPEHEPGVPSFRLEHLAAANGLLHRHAHDALSDVEATIALARRLKTAQPRLYDYAFGLRKADKVQGLLNLADPKPLLHVSGHLPARLGCLTAVLPLAAHPQYKHEVIVADLRQPPEALLTLDAEAIRERVFTPADELPEGIERIGLKGIHRKRSPMLAPMTTLTPERAQRFGLDVEQIQAHAARLRAALPEVREKVRAVFMPPDWGDQDPELALYHGHPSDEDRRLADRVVAAGPAFAAEFDGRFADTRLNTLLFRWRARHAPHTLNEAEREEWAYTLRRRLAYGDDTVSLTLPAFRAAVAERLASETDPQRARWLLELDRWPSESGLLDWLGPDAAPSLLE